MTSGEFCCDLFFKSPLKVSKFRKALLSKKKELAVSSFHLRNLENVRSSQVHGQAMLQS